MHINVVDESIAMKAEPEIFINGGRIDYKLNFKCVHPFGELRFMNGEVLCTACDNQDMTTEQEVMFLEAEADLRHSIDEDRYQDGR